MKKFTLIFVCLTFQFLSVAKNNDIIQCSFDFQAKTYDIHNSFKALTSDNILTTFPYKEYLDSTSWWNFHTIKSSFSELEKIRGVEHNVVNKVLRDCLIDTLLHKWNYENLDSLELLLTVIEKYQSYGEASPELANFFGEVADALGMYVAEKLTDIANNNKEIKSTFRFNYVAQRSRCLKYAPNISLDNTEKTIKYFSEGDFSYLWNRFWNGTSLFFKFAILLPLSFLIGKIIYGISLINQKHLNFKKK